jgi:hypothetical protein
MYRRCAIALLAAVAFVQIASAQVRGMTAVPAAGMSVPGRRLVGAFPSRFEHRGLAQRAIFLGAPFFYPDYSYEPVDLRPTEPPIIVVQAAPATSTAEVSKPGPLLIEWDGTSYVRSDRAAATRPSSAASQAQPLRPVRETSRMQSPKELPPVVLVLRGGQIQQVRNYTIADGILYAHGDYWTDGYWTRPIRLSSLDVPATFAANQQRGVTFVLPSAPNQVIIRP